MDRFAFHRRALHPIALTALLAVAACGGGDDGGGGHTPERIDSAGLLALTEAGQPTVRLLDLDKAVVTHSLKVANAPSDIVASPGGRYALAVQRLQDQAQVIDGGLWQEDHGDHLHDYRAEPRLLTGALSGPRPTHYEVKDGTAALFMDGVADAQQPAAVQVLTEASLARVMPDSSFTLPAAVHGTAEPRGSGFMLVSARTDDAPGTLPNAVDLYQRGAGGWTMAQRFDVPCPDLHGSYSNASYSAFGCSDGVLVIQQNGSAFTAQQDRQPAGAAGWRAHRHHRRPPERGALHRAGRAGPCVRDRPRAQRHHAHHLGGRPHAARARVRPHRPPLRAARRHRRHPLARRAGAVARCQDLAGVAQMPTAAPFPTLLSSRERDTLFVTDVAAKQIAVIDSQNIAVTQSIGLDFSPNGQAWLGIAAP